MGNTQSHILQTAGHIRWCTNPSCDYEEKRNESCGVKPPPSFNENFHWNECYICGDLFGDELPHDFNNATIKRENKRCTQQCNGCGYEKDIEHDIKEELHSQFYQKVCECGYVEVRQKHILSIILIQKDEGGYYSSANMNYAWSYWLVCLNDCGFKQFISGLQDEKNEADYLSQEYYDAVDAYNSSDSYEFPYKDLKISKSNTFTVANDLQSSLPCVISAVGNDEKYHWKECANCRKNRQINCKFS